MANAQTCIVPKHKKSRKEMKSMGLDGFSTVVVILQNAVKLIKMMLRIQKVVTYFIDYVIDVAHRKGSSRKWMEIMRR